LNHIPPKGFMVVRSGGIYSSRKQRKTLELKVKLFGEIEEEAEDNSPHFTCPTCGKELTIVVKYSRWEFKKLFKYWKIIEKEKPPPVYKKFIIFKRQLKVAIKKDKCVNISK